MSRMISLDGYDRKSLAIRSDQIASVAGTDLYRGYKAVVTTLTGQEHRVNEWPDDILKKIADAEEG